MKLLAFALLSLVACTGSLQTGPSSRPPPPREPGPPPPRGDNRPPPPPREPDERLEELAAPQFNDDFRDFIKAGGKGPFKRLRIDVTRGRVKVDQVTIEFDDDAGDKNQTLKVNQEVGAGESMRIDLDGRERSIRRIIVYVDPAQGRRDRGMYRIYAR